MLFHFVRSIFDVLFSSFCGLRCSFVAGPLQVQLAGNGMDVPSVGFMLMAAGCPFIHALHCVRYKTFLRL